MSAAAFAWQCGPIGVLGACFFLWRAGPPPAELQAWRRQVTWTIAAVAGMALVAGVVLLQGEATRIAGHALAPGAPEWRLLLTDTRFGQAWLARAALLLVMAAAGVVATRHFAPAAAVAMLAALAALVIGAWAGHGGATPPLARNLPLHVMHGILAAAWAGALPAWAWLAHRSAAMPAAAPYRARALAAFSHVATLAMAGLLASGLLIALAQFERWPAVVGTWSGALLGAKLALLAGALGCAAWLRERYLPALLRGDAAALQGRAERVIAAETLLAFAVLALGGVLARTPPAAHQDIHWWLPFRIAPAASWGEPNVPALALGGGLLAALAVPAWGFGKRFSACLLLPGGLTLLAYALAVPAFPDTYRRPTVPYTAAAIARGADDYMRHCALCHGRGGRGEPLPATAPAPGTRVPAPDLSEHTSLHTAGDMYWWLTHGMPSGFMPGFGAVLDEGQRWSLVNFLRAFADGHRARVLDERVAPGKPWLGAPNFTYETHDGRHGELRDHREGSPVLLVLAASVPPAAPAIGTANAPAAVAAMPPALSGLLEATAGEVVPLVVSVDGPCTNLEPAFAPHCLVHGGREVAVAYGLLARTLTDPGPADQLLPPPASGAFLVDRYGYLRARWRGRLPATAELRAALTLLAAEPRLRAAPDEHVH